MMSSDCISVSDAIWNSVRDGTQLTAEELRHARTCTSCAETLTEARMAVMALGKMKPHPPAPDCRQQVMSRLNATERRTMVPRLAWAIAPVAAALALLLVVLHGGSQQAIHRSMIVRHPKPPSVHRVLVSKAPARKPVGKLSPVEHRSQPARLPKPILVASVPSALKVKPIKIDSATAPKQPTNDQPAVTRGFRRGDAGCSTQAALDKSASYYADMLDKDRSAFQRTLRSQANQVAAVISSISGNGLMMKSGASASPSGNVVRLHKWGDLPFASVYPVPQPVEAVIPGFGFGKILGAATILDYEASGAYLIFVPIPVELTSEDVAIKSDPNSVVLLAVNMDESGNATYQEHLEAPLIQHTALEGNSPSLVSLSYDDAGLVVEMSWPGECYKFAVKQQLIIR